MENELITTDYIVDYLNIMGIGADLNEAQKYEFIEKCKIWQLNPFKKEIYPIVRKQKDKSVLTIVIGYEVYLNRANLSNVWGGFKAIFSGEIAYKTVMQWEKQVKIIDKEKSTLTCTIRIARKDWSEPFEHQVWLSEFAPETQGIWVEKPRFMLQKVGICQAFRMCFSECMGLPYSSEEASTFVKGNVEIPEKPVSEYAANVQARIEQIDKEAAETAQILPNLAAKPENSDNTQADAQIGLDAVKTTLLLQINNCVLKGYNGYSDKENLKKDLKEKLGVEGTSLNDAVAKCKDIDFITNYIEFLNTKIQSDSPFTYGDTSNPVSNDLTDKQQKAIRLLDNLAELTIDGYQTQKHRSASIKDHLGTVTVNACKDIAKLDDYIIHLEKQVTK
jgi:phage recombination protein Bet